MAENFDKLVYESPLYPLLKVVGYRFHGALKSQKAVDIELSKIASAIEKHKEKLTPEQAEIYQKALDDMAKPAKEKKE